MAIVVKPKMKGLRPGQKPVHRTPELSLREKPVITRALRAEVMKYAGLPTYSAEINFHRNMIFDSLFRIREICQTENEVRNVDEMIAELSQPIIERTAGTCWKKMAKGRLGKTIPAAFSEGDLTGEGNLLLLTNVIPTYDISRKDKSAFHTYLVRCLRNRFSLILRRPFKDAVSYHGFDEEPDFNFKKAASRQPHIVLPEEAQMSRRLISKLERAIGEVTGKKRREVMNTIFEDVLHPLSDAQTAKRRGVSPS